MTTLRAALILLGLFYAVVSGVAEHRYRAAMERGDWAAVTRAARLWPLSARLREAAATLPALRDDVAPAAALAALRRELRWRPWEPKLLFWISYQCWRLSGTAAVVRTPERGGRAWKPEPDHALGGEKEPSEAQSCAIENFVTLSRLSPHWPQTMLLRDLLFSPLDAADVLGNPSRTTHRGAQREPAP